MSHVLNWWSLSNDKIKEFLEVNDIEVPYTFEEAIDLADELYRGELKEGVIITNSVIELEKEYGTRLRQLYGGPDYIIAYELDYQDVLNFCRSDELIAKVCKEVEFWKYWLSKRTGLDIEFFIPFDMESIYRLNLENIHLLREDYDKYEKTGDFKYLKDYRDIVNRLFLEEYIKYVEDYGFMNDVFVVRYGGLPTIRYIVETLDQSLSIATFNSPRKDINTLNVAAQYDNFELVEYLIDEYGIIPEQETLNNAAQSGNLELVKYFIDEYDIIPERETLNIAVHSGNLELVKYLINEYDITPQRRRILTLAVGTGNLELVKYIINKYNLEPNLDILTSRLRYDFRSRNLELMKYLIEGYNLEPDQNMLMFASRSGDLELMKYLIEGYNLEPDQITLDNAAHSGNIELMEYLIIEFGLIPNQHTVINSIIFGDLEFVKYLITNYVPTLIPHRSFRVAITSRNRNIEIVKYFIETLQLFSLSMFSQAEIERYILRSELSNIRLRRYLLSMLEESF